MKYRIIIIKRGHPFLLICLLCLGCFGAKPYVRPHDYIATQKAKMLYELAESYMNEKKYHLAIPEYRRYIDLYPDMYNADESYMKIGECYEALKQYNEAINTYKLLLKKYRWRKSDYLPQAMYRMGLCYEFQEDYKNAVKTYMKLIKKYYKTQWGPKAVERATEVLAKFPESKWAAKATKKLERLVKKQEKK